MCGLFGYTSKTRRPDLGRLRAIALETQQRGAHAFGLAWIDPDGSLHAFKRPGPISAYLHELDRCRDARVLVCHCRYATHGHPADNRNNHPHRVGRGWLVHNGVVRNHRDIADRYGLWTTTDCDSEVLGLLMAKVPGALERRAAITVDAAEGPLALLGLWAKPARLLLVRRGNPLWVGRIRSAVYFGSLPGELPGLPEPLPEGVAIVWTPGGERAMPLAGLRDEEHLEFP
jgi:glucosamine 6-phosphate synthetase-like amidotransferase/phosphosugar isomerase protein